MTKEAVKAGYKFDPMKFLEGIELPWLVDLRTSVPCSFCGVFIAFLFHLLWRVDPRGFCVPQFVSAVFQFFAQVQFGWSILSYLRCSFLFCPRWLAHPHVICAQQLFSNTRDSRMLHITSIVSWIALVFVGLRELTEVASWAQATDRVETCEVLEDRLHELEAELKELREESCWIFQFRCSWTCSLLLLASFAIPAGSWCCVAPAVRGGGMMRWVASFWKGNVSWVVVVAFRTHFRTRGSSTFLVGCGRSLEQALVARRASCGSEHWSPPWSQGAGGGHQRNLLFVSFIFCVRMPSTWLLPQQCGACPSSWCLTHTVAWICAEGTRSLRASVTHVFEVKLKLSTDFRLFSMRWVASSTDFLHQGWFGKCVRMCCSIIIWSGSARFLNDAGRADSAFEHGFSICGRIDIFNSWATSSHTHTSCQQGRKPHPVKQVLFHASQCLPVFRLDLVKEKQWSSVCTTITPVLLLCVTNQRQDWFFELLEKHSNFPSFWKIASSSVGVEFHLLCGFQDQTMVFVSPVCLFVDTELIVTPVIHGSTSELHESSLIVFCVCEGYDTIELVSEGWFVSTTSTHLFFPFCVSHDSCFSVWSGSNLWNCELFHLVSSNFSPNVQFCHSSCTCWCLYFSCCSCGLIEFISGVGVSLCLSFLGKIDMHLVVIWTTRVPFQVGTVGFSEVSGSIITSKLFEKRDCGSRLPNCKLSCLS